MRGGCSFPYLSPRASGPARALGHKARDELLRRRFLTGVAARVPSVAQKLLARRLGASWPLKKGLLKELWAVFWQPELGYPYRLLGAAWASTPTCARNYLLSKQHKLVALSGVYGAGRWGLFPAGATSSATA